MFLLQAVISDVRSATSLPYGLPSCSGSVVWVVSGSQLRTVSPVDRICFRTKTRFGGAGIDIAEAAMIDLAFAGVHQVVDSMPRVHAATQYLEEDPELAELCRTDGEGPAELAERIDNISHSMCTLENPLWYSHRRAALANKTHEGRLLALIVRD